MRRLVNLLNSYPIFSKRQSAATPSRSAALFAFSTSQFPTMNTPTPHKISPEFKVLALSESAISKAQDHNFGFRDEIRALIKRDRGDSNGTAPLVSVDTTSNPATGAPWANQPAFESIDPTIDYLEFTGETVKQGATAATGDLNAKDGVSGFALKARAVPVNCVVATGDAKGAPGGKPSLKKLHFKQKKPHSLDNVVIETVKPFSQDATCVNIRQTAPDKTVEFESEEKLEANQQLKCTLFWINVDSGQTQKAGARVAWGSNEWSVVFRQDAENNVLPVLERFVSGQWTTVRKYEAARFAKFTGTTTLTVRRMGGRLVIMLATGDAHHTFETILSRTSNNPSIDPETISAKWRSGKINVTSFGVRLRFGLELVDYSDAQDAPQQGDFTRKIPRSLKTSGFALDEIGDAPSNGSGKAEIYTSGWRTRNNQIKRRATVDHTGLTYTLRLLASPDKHDSPFVMTVLGNFSGSETEGEGEPLDITSAFSTGSIDAASPETQTSGTVLNLNFSRNLLKTLGQAKGVEWKEWLKQYRLITFEVRWLLSDGTHSDWDSIGSYYIEDSDFDNPSVNQWTLRLSCHDPMMRLTAPHSTIDYRYLYDLVFLLLRKNEGRGGELYGGECAKYIIGVELGAAEAERLNGTGDPLRFMPEGHFSLLSSRAGGVGYLQIAGNDMAPPTFNKVVMPPPHWNCSALDWLHDIGTKDFAVPFYAPVPGGDGRPCPIWADVDEWMKNAPTWTLADDNYDDGDLDFIIKNMKVARKGNANYNTVQALWSAPQGNQTPFQATRVAEGRLPASDSNSEEKSWRRTYVQDKVVWWNPEATRAWVHEFLGSLEGVDVRWPTLTLARGDARIWWGHKAQIKSRNDGTGAKYSDPDLSLEGTLFRVLKVSHSFSNSSKGADAFTTTLSLFPLFNGEE